MANFWRSVNAARIGPSRRDEVERAIVRKPNLSGIPNEDKYEDQSEIAHEFGDGWTIRKLTTRGDYAREGMLMSNCIGDEYRPEEFDSCTGCVTQQGTKKINYRKNVLGKCVECNDTTDITPRKTKDAYGWRTYKERWASNFSPCDSCRNVFKSCSNRNCGNSTNRQEWECQSRWTHKTVLIDEPKEFRKKDKNGFCANCNGSGLIFNGTIGTNKPYQKATGRSSQIFSLRDPNNVPKVSLDLNMVDSYSCENHFSEWDEDDFAFGDRQRPVCHEHGVGNCCPYCGGLDRANKKAPGPKVIEMQGRGNNPPEQKYMSYVDSFLYNMRQNNRPETVTEIDEPTGPKTMQQMLEQTQKLLKRPMTPQDIESLRAIISKKAALSSVCKKCGSSDLNHPKISDETGMSLCLNCGEFNEHI